MRVVCISAECEPWAKTGGLGDVVDALARAVASVGRRRSQAASTVVQSQVWIGTGGVMGQAPGGVSGLVERPVDVFLPLYRGVVGSGWDATVKPLSVPDPLGAGRRDRGQARRVRGSRLPRPPDRPPAGVRSRGLLRRRRRRLSRQRLALRPAVPRRARGAAGRRPAAGRAPPPRLAVDAGGADARHRLRRLPADLTTRRSWSRSTTSPTRAGCRASSWPAWPRPTKSASWSGPTPTGSCCCARGSSGRSWSTPSAPATPRRS